MSSPYQSLHNHTVFCDGKNTVEEMILAAIEQGLDSIGFSGHAPMPHRPNWCMDEATVPLYRAEVLRQKEKYADRIRVYLGIEQDYFSPALDAPYDFIIGSVHVTYQNGRYCRMADDGAEFGYGGDYLRMAEDYYGLVADVVRKTGCQVVGHLDLLSKYNEGNKLFDMSHPRYMAAALGALDELARQNTVLEINTGAMARGYRSEPHPSRVLLQAMYERHIPICFASDAHRTGDLLYGFPFAAQMARDCGYREYMYWNGTGFESRPIPEE